MQNVGMQTQGFTECVRVCMCACVCMHVWEGGGVFIVDGV